MAVPLLHDAAIVLGRGRIWRPRLNPLDFGHRKGFRSDPPPHLGSVGGGPTKDLLSSSSLLKEHSKEDARKFKELLPDVIRELTTEGVYKDVPVFVDHYSKCLQYNLVHGKLTRGLAVPITYKLVTPESLHTEEMLKLANLLGWCIELMQAFFLVSDDVMDGSTTRRGQECWYKKPEIGLMAINDALLLEKSVYYLLHKHFGQKPQYPTLLDAFLKTTMHTTTGQSLDMLSQVKRSGGRASLNHCNMDLYNNIVKLKTAYYSFYLPVQIGMGLANIQDQEVYRQAKDILLETGKFFQVQDDYLDCFGDPEITGKVGKDIQDGKCSWLLVMALQRASPSQKEVLETAYCSHVEKDVATVKEVYEDLKLPKVYHRYEEHMYREIEGLINQLSGNRRPLNPEVFYYFLNRIYKRSS